MKYIYLFCITLLLLNCKSNSTKNIVINDKNDIYETVDSATILFIQQLNTLIKNLPDYNHSFSSENLTNYVIDNDEGYFINQEVFTNKAILKQSILNKTKGQHSIKDTNYNISDKKYFPLYKLQKDSFVIIGSFVQYYGENDIPGVFFQLHTLDYSGNQIDYLIAYNRFSFELALKTNFKTNNTFSEFILESTEENWLILDENGEFVGERKSPILKNTIQKFILEEMGNFEEN